MPSREEKDAGERAEGIPRLLEYAGRKRWLVVLGCVLSGVSAVLALAPYLCAWYVARNALAALPDLPSGSSVIEAGLLAAGCAAASVVLYMAGLSLTHRAAFHIARNIRSACSEHLLAVPLGYFQGRSSGELRRRVDAGADLTEDVIAHKLPDVTATVVTPLAVVALSFALDWRMGLACLAPVVVGACMLGATMGPAAAKAMDDYQDALDAMNAEAVEYVRGMPVVKVFQRSVFSFRRFYRTIVAYGNLAYGFAQASMRPQVLFATVTSASFVLLVPVAALAAGAVETGGWARFVADFVFYAMLCGIVPGMLTRVMYVGQSTMSARTALRNVDEILSVEPLPVACAPARMRDASVAFEGASFRYEGSDRDAVHRVSFSVAPGQTVALVGPSGSGKSTCASLIPRFWDVDEGRVVVGGSDVRDLDPRALLENVAFVFQGGRLFPGTVIENVILARSHATREEALRALSDAQCDDILAKLPKGADTLVGPGGTFLSGGEAQRVLLARALCKDAPIVVLDEATAFADADNEARIQAALERVMEDRTVVMIAHRLQTVVGADLIVVMSEGEVAEVGTHAELLSAGGVYARMWEDCRRAAVWEIAARPEGGDAQ